MLAALAVIGVAIAVGLWISSGGDGGADADADARQGSEHLGEWLTQIATYDSSQSEDVVDRGISSFAASGLEVDVLLSDDFASLAPGSWTFYESAWPTSDEAVARCVEIGRTERNQCLARLLSDDEADRDQVRFVGE